MCPVQGRGAPACAVVWMATLPETDMAKDKGQELGRVKAQEPKTSSRDTSGPGTPGQLAAGSSGQGRLPGGMHRGACAASGDSSSPN